MTSHAVISKPWSSPNSRILLPSLSMAYATLRARVATGAAGQSQHRKARARRRRPPATRACAPAPPPPPPPPPPPHTPGGHHQPEWYAIHAQLDVAHPERLRVLPLDELFKVHACGRAGWACGRRQSEGSWSALGSHPASSAAARAPAYAELRPLMEQATMPSNHCTPLLPLFTLLAPLLTVTQITPTASTGMDTHCTASSCCPSNQYANSAVGTSLKDWLKIWNETASRCVAAMISRTCRGARARREVGGPGGGGEGGSARCSSKQQQGKPSRTLLAPAASQTCQRAAAWAGSWRQCPRLAAAAPGPRAAPAWPLPSGTATIVPSRK